MLRLTYKNLINHFDLSEIVHNISYFTTINFQPSKLTFSIEDHFNNPEWVGLENGAKVEFYYGKDKLQFVFSGTVFNWGKSKNGSYEVTCYDDTRYLKNSGDWYMMGFTTSSAFTKIFSDLNMQCVIKQPSVTQLKNYLFLETPYWEMIEHIVNETLVENYTAGSSILNYYYIKTTKEGIVVDTINNNMTDLIIGDESLLIDYDYSEDIDTDTYNEVVIVKTVQKDNLGSAGERTVDVKANADSQMRIGLLRKMIAIKDESEKEQAQKYADLFLQLKDRVKKSIRLTALGYDGIYAGNGFTFKSKKLRIFQQMYVISATHNYEMDKHTMELEVSIV